MNLPSLGLLATALYAAPFGADSAARPLTLAEAVDLALHNAPAVVQSAGETRTRRAEVRAAYAAFVPGVTLNAGATRQYTSGANTRVENGQIVTLPRDPWSSSGSLGASVDLFTGGRRLFDLKRARAGETAASADAVTQRFQVELEVKQQYFNELAARESETAARAQLEQSQRQLRDAIAKLRAQSASKSDSLRSIIQVRNAELALLTAQNDRTSAAAALTRIVGAPEPVTASGADVGESVTLALEADAVAQLAARGPAVREAEAQLEAARASRWTAYARYLPTVSAGYSRGASGTSPDFGVSDTYTYSGSLRFSLSLPLFDQLGREQQVVEAGVALDNAEAALRDARLAARQNLTQSLGAFQTALQHAAALAASVEAAEEDLRVQQQRYTAGEATLLDVLASQTQLAQSRESLIRARYDARVAKAQLEALVGREL